MKNLFLVLIIAGFCNGALNAQPKSYSAAGIAENLKAKAHVVKRYEQIYFEVKDVDRTTMKSHQVYTVLDKEGKRALTFGEHESKFQRLEDVDIKVYNALGEQIGRYRKKDLEKSGWSSGLVEDGINYYLEIGTNNYPVTVEYKYEINYYGTLFYPRYTIIETDESVEQTSCVVRVPAELGLRYKQQKTSIVPTITKEGKIDIYTWQASNLPPLEQEEGSVSNEFYNPTIFLAPNKFRIYNTNGDMSSWKSFGLWSRDLHEGLEVLPEERKAFFVELVKGATSEREKVARIYRYLQENFRYVSIQLKIGGWKSFPAKFTDEKKYGDCKGLSLYMYAALKAVGIKSHLARINAQYNKEPVDPTFPASMFNHVILCVPQPKDSIWLECTSNTAEFGVLGSFTENRNALLVTENGGVLVATPKSKASNNLFNAKTLISLREDGSGTSHTTTYTRGDMYEVMDYITKAKKDEQKRIIVQLLGFKQPDEFNVVKGNIYPGLQLDIDMQIEKIPQFTAGTKMFLNPRIYSLWKFDLPKSEGRKQDYYFQTPFVKTDTTCYQLPKDYMVDKLPAASSFGCRYALYATEYLYDAGKNMLVTVTRLELKQNRIPAEDYAEVKSFFDKVLSDNTQKLIVKKI